MGLGLGLGLGMGLGLGLGWGLRFGLEIGLGFGFGFGLESVELSASARCCSRWVRSHRTPPSEVRSAGGTRRWVVEGASSARNVTPKRRASCTW